MITHHVASGTLFGLAVGAIASIDASTPAASTAGPAVASRSSLTVSPPAAATSMTSSASPRESAPTVRGVRLRPAVMSPPGVPAGEQGVLYFSRDDDPEGLFTLDMGNGAATHVGTSGVTSNTVGLAAAGETQTLFGSRWDVLMRIRRDGGGSDVVGGAGFEGLTYHRATNTLYGTLNNLFFTVDQDTGERLQMLAAPFADVEGLAFGGENIYGIAGGSDSLLYRYAPEANEWTIVGDTGISWARPGLAFNRCDESLYAKGAQDTMLYRIDPDDASVQLVGDTGIDEGGGLAWDGECVDPCDFCPCPGDVNRDGVVDLSDILLVLAEWGPCPEEAVGGFWNTVVGRAGDPCAECSCRADLVVRDGVVDIQEMLRILADFGPCDQPTGACCLLDGTCEDGYSELRCVTSRGTYRGDGSTCGMEECPPPTGACCVEAYFCIDGVDEDACLATDGVYRGDGTICPSDCVGVFGACCLQSGECIDTVFEETCTGMGGTFQGGGTSCEPGRCEPP